MEKNKTIILGGGLAGLSLASFLKRDTLILEKEEHLGGLCRSFDLGGIKYDIGPHIIFSKNEKILEHMTSIVQTNKIKRSNQILYNGKFIKYPFENNLFALSDPEREYCLKEFLNNPYESYVSTNMLQFFLKTFGEGITRLYLQPYNEKIWKLDPSFMDTQMVERIPKPPREDIINSAKGIASEGYLHQLYFNYPKSGGIESLSNYYREATKDKVEIINPVIISKVEKVKEGWRVSTDKGVFKTETLINCMPIHELFKVLEAPDDIKEAVADLKYNSIHIIMIQTTKDQVGDNFAMTVPNKDIIFHRLSKLNFFGENYILDGDKSTIMAEITFRPDSYISTLSKETIIETVIEELDKLSLVTRADIVRTDIRTFEYAYVIYDLNHRKNADKALEYLGKLEIKSAGRFAEFEYLNMDAVIERTQRLADKLN